MNVSTTIEEFFAKYSTGNGSDFSKYPNMIKYFYIDDEHICACSKYLVTIYTIENNKPVALSAIPWQPELFAVKVFISMKDFFERMDQFPDYHLYKKIKEIIRDPEPEDSTQMVKPACD